MVYKKVIIKETPRLLGLLDRNPLSATYGCFDRNYWHYKISDFPCARFQEGVLVLTYLYNMKGTEFYRNKKIFSWIIAGLNFWKKIQHTNGSFDEWYPHENSFVATSFSTCAITESLIILKKEIEKSTYLDAITRAGNWLKDRTERRAQNQDAGAIMALYNIYLITGNEKFKKIAEDKLEGLLNEQTDEGWFYEYGGPDIGYLSLCVDYLAKYYKRTGNRKVLQALKKALEFLKYFLHPDMTVGGTYGSRNTEYLIPNGFEILSSKDRNAQIIASHMIKSLEQGKIIGPNFLDDRYLVYNGYTYLQASENFYKNKIYQPMYKKNFTKDFPRAGILIHSYKGNYLIVNYRKGGAYKQFYKNKLISTDSGIEGVYNKKKCIGDVTDRITKNDGKYILEGRFRTITNQTISPKKNVIIRVFQSSFGRNEKIGKILKEKMRNRLITDRDFTKLRFKREIIFEKNKIKVKDSIPEVIEISQKGKHSYDFIPSSKYFQYSDLE